MEQRKRHEDLILYVLTKPHMYLWGDPSFQEVMAYIYGLCIASRSFEADQKLNNKFNDFYHGLTGEITHEEHRTFWPDFRSKHDSDAQAIAALYDAYEDFLDRNYPLPDA